MNKNSKRAEATKQDLQDAFIRLYAQKDIQSISIKDITDLAGYHRGTFYRYYLDIYDLFDKIKSDLLRQFTQMAQVLISQTKGVMYTEVVSVILDFYSAHEKYLLPLMNRDGTMLQSLIEVMRPIFFSKLVDISPEEGKKLNYLLEYHFAGVLNVISSWSKRGKDIPQAELIAAIYDGADKGVLTVFREKGLF